jgi:hypothetical protein
MKAIFIEDELLENCANEGLDERLGVELQLEELGWDRPKCGDRPKDALEKELDAWREKEDWRRWKEKDKDFKYMVDFSR